MRGDLDIRNSDLVGWGIGIGLVVWFLAAVMAVKNSGNCWQDCDSATFIEYDLRPLGLWLAGLGAAICVGLWSLTFRRGASPLRMLLWGVPAVIATGYWARGLSLVL